MCNKQPDGELLRVHPPVLLKADDPLYRMPDPDSMGYVFLMPEGPRQINEAGADAVCGRCHAKSD